MSPALLMPSAYVEVIPAPGKSIVLNCPCRRRLRSNTANRPLGARGEHF